MATLRLLSLSFGVGNNSWPLEYKAQEPPVFFKFHKTFFWSDRCQPGLTFSNSENFEKDLGSTHRLSEEKRFPINWVTCFQDYVGAVLNSTQIIWAFRRFWNADFKGILIKTFHAGKIFHIKLFCIICQMAPQLKTSMGGSRTCITRFSCHVVII